MTKTKSPPKKTKSHSGSHSHLNSSSMDKVKIKRVKRNKKEVTAKEKIMAGIGVGSTLLGGASMVSPQSNPTQFVRTQNIDSNKKSNIVKDTLKKIFGIESASASTPSEIRDSAIASAQASKDSRTASITAWRDQANADADTWLASDPENPDAQARKDEISQAYSDEIASINSDYDAAVIDANATYESVIAELDASNKDVVDGSGNLNPYDPVVPDGLTPGGGVQVETIADGSQKVIEGVTYTYTGGVWVENKTETPPVEGVTTRTTSDGFTETYYQGNWVLNNDQIKTEGGKTYITIGGAWVERPAGLAVEGTKKTENGIDYVVVNGEWVVDSSGSSNIPIYTGTDGVVSNVADTVNGATQGTISINGIPQTLAVTSDGRIFDTSGQDITNLFATDTYQKVIDSFSKATPVNIDAYQTNNTLDVTGITADTGILDVWANGITGELTAYIDGIGNVKYNPSTNTFTDSNGKILVNLDPSLKTAFTTPLSLKFMEGTEPVNTGGGTIVIPPPSGTRTDSAQELINMSDIDLLKLAGTAAGTSILSQNSEAATRVLTLYNRDMPNSIEPGSLIALYLQGQFPSNPTNGQIVKVNGDANFTYKYNSTTGSYERTSPATVAPVTTTPTVGTAGVPVNANGSLKQGWIAIGDLVYYDTKTGLYSDKSGQFQYTTLNQFNDVVQSNFLKGFTYKADPNLPGGFNPAQYASQETALAVAKALGLPASSVTLTTVVGPIGPYPQYVITFPNGVVVNAGLVAQEYLRYAPDVANDMIRAEVARGGGSYTFTGANFGNGTESSVIATNVPVDAGAAYANPTTVQQRLDQVFTPAATTTVTQPGVNTNTNAGVGLVIGTPLGTSTSANVVVTSVSAFDTQGKNANGQVSYGYTIEIGGVGLTAYNSFALNINGSSYQVTRSVVSDNKITLTVPNSLPTGIATGTQVRIILSSNRTNVNSGPLSQILVFKNATASAPVGSVTVTPPANADNFNTGETPAPHGVVDPTTPPAGTAQVVSVITSQTSVSVRVGATSTVSYTVSVQGILGYGVVVTSSNPNIATAVANTSTGIITVTGIAPGAATLIIHPAGVVGTQYDKMISVVVSPASSGAQDNTGGGASSGNMSTGNNSGGGSVSTGGGSSSGGVISGTGTGSTNNTGGSGNTGGISQTDAQALRNQIAQLQRQIADLNSRSSGGTTIVNNTDFAQINSLRQQVLDLQNRLNSGAQNSSASQPFHGLQMPSGYPNNAPVGLQYQAPAEVKGAETNAVYTVKKGDNLWNIAKKYYGDGKQWRKILTANPNCLSRPGDTKTLKIGAQLVIPN